MAKIPAHFLDDLIARADIVELIDQRVPLKRAGHEYKACCPFHDEKTPSFTVSQQKQFYHCFGCGAHGTAIGFLMNYDNLSFLEAVEELAGRVGMVVPKEAQASPADSQVPQLQELVEKAQRWFLHNLRKHPAAPAVVQYLKDRGLSGEIAATFGIGFAPEQWDGLLIHLGARQQNQALLAKAGLLIEKEGGAYYDRFRNRVMFPIEDYRGRIVGFGGRIIGDGEPKYLNSPETPLFHKGSELYNLHRARRAISELGYSIVVEGYMDVIGLAQFEVSNVVATLGTATTANHLQRLFRAAPTIVFCFDGDRAGREAAWRALKIALPALKDGRQASILLLPEGEDPDSLVRKEGADAFQNRVQSAKPLSDFLFESLTEQIDMSSMEGRAKLSEQARPLLQTIPEGAFRELMLKRLTQVVGINQTLGQLSEPLSSPFPDQSMSTPSLAERMDSWDSGNSSDRANQYPNRQPDQSEPTHLSAVALAISLLIQNPELASQAAPSGLEPNQAPKGFDLLQHLIEMVQSSAEPLPDSATEPNRLLNTAQILERIRQNPEYANHHQRLENLASRNHMIDTEKQSDVFADCLARIEQSAVQAQIDQLLFKAGTQPLSEAENTQLKSLLAAQKKA